MISNRAKAISPSLTLGISAKVKQMKAEGQNVINLSIGEPDFLTPDGAKEGAIYAIENNLTKYDVASGNKELKEAIVAKLKKDNGLNYKVSQIVVTSGAKHAITNALLATVNPDEEVIIPHPYWVSYPEMVSIVGGKPIILKTDIETGYKLTLEALKEQVTDKTKMVIITNPSNPTGNVYTKEELQPICEYLAERDIYILADEIYERIVYDEEFTSIPSLSEKIKEMTILIGGVAKSHSMTGWRIGYTATNEELASAMGKIQSHLTSHPSTVSMQAARFALEKCDADVEKMKETYKERRDMIIDFFKDVPEIGIVPPRGAFYVFLDISKLEGKLPGDSLSMAFCDRMLDKGIALVPGIGFGEDHGVRLSYAASLDDIKTGLEKIKELVDEIKNN